ncbi:hypothetical protein [Brevundimonas sp.]|uniref:hypothetical protein n=1 Tax=Brevundimonas sp. TaxID=1871086 RepID=UPI00260EC352|nr:hypothetical protein [Brevundimonas sp.]
MTAYANTTLTNRVDLDGNTFTNVKFLGAELHYNGGTPPEFRQVDFIQSRFVFDGPAMNTVEFLRTMSSDASNMSSVVQGLLPQLRPQAFPTVRPANMTYRATSTADVKPKG